jgi:hypothetical protein
MDNLFRGPHPNTPCLPARLADNIVVWIWLGHTAYRTTPNAALHLHLHPRPSLPCLCSSTLYAHATMAATDAQRKANDAYLIGYRNSAISAGLKGQPANTSRAYKKSQADFIASRPLVLEAES